MKNSMLKKLVLFSIVMLSAFVGYSSLQAASVQSCRTVTSQKGDVKTFCNVKLEEGMIGDKVTVLNSKAHIVGKGRISSRKAHSPYAIIALSEVTESIRRNYPVLVDVENRRTSNIQYAASFSNAARK